ncbi:MAG: hypothetical protein AAFQ23_09440, partial [Cyanobacteria bacterium J06623_1]
MENNKKRRNTLFALEQSLFGDQTSQQQSYQSKKKQKKKQKKRKQPQEQEQVYDFGEAIELQYNNEAFPTVTPKAESFSAPNFFASELEDESLPFTVEAFEVEEDTPYTVCFCGTACTRDEGEVSRTGSDHRIYSPSTGYIPVRIHTEISGRLGERDKSVTVRGVGVYDWASSSKSEKLVSRHLRPIPSKLSDWLKSYSEGAMNKKFEQLAGKKFGQLAGKTLEQLAGWESAALALHGANKAVASEASQFNFIGHSRGAVECIMAAWFLYAYGDRQFRHIPINIFAIDPVPGPGNWWGIFTQLPPNVANYVGIYAWDHVGILKDTLGFKALVP